MQKIRSILLCFIFLSGMGFYTTSSHGSAEDFVEDADYYEEEDHYKEVQRSTLAQFRFDVSILKQRQLHAELDQADFEERFNLALRDHEIQEKGFSESILNLVTKLKKENRDALTEEEFRDALKIAAGIELQEKKLQKCNSSRDCESSRVLLQEDAVAEEDDLGNSAFFPAEKKAWTPDFWQGAALGAAAMAGVILFVKSKEAS